MFKVDIKRKIRKITLYFKTTKNTTFSKFLFLYLIIYKWIMKICITKFVITKLVMQKNLRKSIIKSGNTNLMIDGF